MSSQTHSSTGIRVLIADDQKLFAESLHYVIEARAPDIHVVGVVNDGNEAIVTTRELEPDLVLMDVRMPSVDGVMATQAIHASLPAVRILMLSTFQDDGYVRKAVAAGAVGYLLKNIAPEEVITAIRAVKGGLVQMSPGVAKALTRGETLPSDESYQALLIDPLTRREREVLLLIERSLENRKIAEFLNVTEQTAKNYIHNIYGKLGVNNRMQLMQLLQDSGTRRRLDLDISPS